MIYQKLAFILGLRCVKGILFIRVALKKIKLAKELFTMGIEQGEEVYIPKELAQNKLP